MQQGMLFHSVEGAAPGVDIEQVVCALDHRISAPEFEQAWRLLVCRHETFRTTFTWDPGEEPRQVVLPAEAVVLPFRVLDLAAGADAELMIEEYLAADRRAAFPTLSAPLARVALFQCEDDRAWFVLTYHHLILDARAMAALFRELLDTHDALAAGRRPELPPVRAYAEYISWLGTLDARRAEVFWREHLQGLATPPPLPLAMPADPVGSLVSGELSTRFSAAETEHLRQAAKRYGVTLNTLLQGAWALVLSRHLGEDDVVFGAVRACRHVPVEGAATMVGMLINTVPVRVRLAPDASVEHWLHGLREQWLALRDYEHTPLMQVQRWSGVAGGRPLFETIFNYQEPSWIETLRQLGGRWRERRFEIRSQPNTPLALDLYGDECLLIRAFYDRRRFADAGVGAMLRQFRAAIHSLGSGKVDRLRDVTLLDRWERHQVLRTFNATAVDYPGETTVQREFERQVAAGPERLAVADPAVSLSYGELNERADALSRRLRQLGVRRDAAVAVCMPRAAAMLVAWLGAVKAGGAFVPLDPEYPAERLAFQLQDCGAPVLIVLGDAVPPLSPPPGVTVVRLDRHGQCHGGAAAPTDPCTEPADASAPDALAYIIYTSGSTGQPKGVEVRHRSLMNLVSWHQRTYAVTSADRATHLASPAFDASVWEIWPYLAAGASIHIPDDETRVSPARLWPWMAAQGITLAFLPTPLAEAALSEPWPESLALRALLTGGDQLKRPAPASFPCPLINHYGPTESTVVATAALVPPSCAGAPPIGRPIANTQAYVLDRQQRPVPIGVVGELYLGGESLARGYRNRDELTAERFIPSPFPPNGDREAEFPPAKPGGSDPASTRLYRTGDLVRWRLDGQLEFVGRADNQVKIRGCRIELGEIEAALQRHPAVREALVTVRADERGQYQLVGYVIARPEVSVPESDLLEYLRSTIPAYMVPAALVRVETWPLTPNGKVDRRALPAPIERPARSTDSVAPRTPDEHVVARVWALVLGREAIGLHDNFFELGGHSLLAAQAITHLNAAFGSSISVRTIFDHPTVAEFAAQLRRTSATNAPRPALRPKRRGAADLELVQPR